MQVLLFCYAWYCALTRVSDYKHHPTDVLAGGVLGTIVAVFCALVALRGQRRERIDQQEVREQLL